MAADLLLEAEALVDGFCQQLRHLLEQSGQQQQELAADSRQLHRLVDETQVRLRLVNEGTNPALVDANRLRTTYEAALQEERDLLANLAKVTENSRRLDLLLRQVEMSGRSLRSEIHLRPYDPWELALRSQVLYGREQERSALAREVHDGPAQVLSNIALGLERCRQATGPEELEALLTGLLRDVRLGLQEVRRFIYDLRPSPLAKEPLGQQIERYIQDLESAYQLTVEYHWGPPPRELVPEEEVAIYRIVQEALQNARKHARADRISVETYAEATGWIVQVSDNGSGFDPRLAGEQQDHWGISGMRERARLIGADLQLTSQVGEGTKIRLCLPLHPADRAEERS